MVRIEPVARRCEGCLYSRLPRASYTTLQLITTQTNFHLIFETFKMVDAKKSPKKAAAPSHPPYAQMITDAITGIGGKF